MSNRSLQQLLIALTAFLDILLVGVSVLLSHWIRFHSGWLDRLAVHQGGAPPLDAYFQLAPLMGLIWVLTLRAKGLYRIENRPTAETLLNLSKASAIALTATLGGVFFLYHRHEYSRWVMILACAMNAGLLFLNRQGIYRFKMTLQKRGVGLHRVAIVGINATTHRLIQTLEHNPQHGNQLVGVILNDVVPSIGTTVPIIGATSDIRSIVQKYQIDELFVASPTNVHAQIVGIVHACEGLTTQITVLPDLYDVMMGRTRVTTFEGIPVVKLRELPLQGWRSSIKRGVDIVFSLLALILLSPLMLIIAVAVKLTSPGEVIFRQERLSRAGRPFYIYKFRTMRLDAEKGVGHSWATRNDPRQTWLGRILRRWSFDELPQFFNVLKGDMSLVGPRPEMSGLIDDFSRAIPHYLDRHRVKCGITGWAQVNGLRGNTSLEARIQHDLYYIENWSLGLDFRILLRTLWAIVQGSK